MSTDPHATRPTGPAPATTPPPSGHTPLPQVGEELGPYRLIELLGQGGFGVVYLAEQREPVRRRVALKLLKPGMDSREVLARFEAERQALALMDHPGVSKVHDAGVTPLGRPFFVMEHVSGLPLTTYCDRGRLSVRDRVGVFVDVCRAAQHAHQKGIIHRDLKPSNVLVAEVDGRPSPKIIDFGIAKALHGSLSDEALHTRAGQMIGTPEYMSPEQTTSGGRDVDTRSDVYALGVILYELLTGVLPFDPEVLRSGGYDTIRRLILEVDPPKPSTRVAAQDARAAGAPDTPGSTGELARRRSSTAPSLVRELRGDLDWIVMRALEKDRARRYDSAAALADDLERFLRGDAVLAGPPGVSYRTGKFLRRHRLGVGVAGTFLVLAAGGVVALGLAYERQQEALAKARRESARANAALELVRDMFHSVEPAVAKGKEPLVKDVIDAAVRTLGERNDLDAGVESTVRSLAGIAYHELGLVELAEPQIRRALELSERVLGPDDPETLSIRHNLAAALIRQSRLDEAGELLDRTIADRSRVLGPMHPDTLASRSTRIALMQRQDRHAQAEPLARGLVADQTKALGPASRDTLDTRLSLADILSQIGKLDEAQREAADIVRVADKSLGESDPITLSALSIQAAAAQSLDHADEAERIDREILDRRRRTLGEEHPETILSLDQLAGALKTRGKLEEARETQQAAVDRALRVFGGEHLLTAAYQHNLAAILQRLGKLDEAEQLYRAAYEVRKKQLGDSSQTTLVSLNQLGLLMLDRGRAAEALPVLQTVFEGLQRALPAGHWMLGASRTCVGECLKELKRYDEAERWLTQAFEQLSASVGPTHSRTQRAVNDLVSLYESQGRPTDVQTWKAKRNPAPAPPATQ